MTDRNKENSFLFAGNALFIEELYDRYLLDKASVDVIWQKYFQEYQDAVSINHPSWSVPKKSIIGIKEETEAVSKNTKVSKDQPKSESNHFDIKELINNFRKKGHLLVKLDPLGLEKLYTEEDLGLSINSEDPKIQELHKKLKKIYCSSIAYEIEHISCSKQRGFLYEQAEKAYQEILGAEKEKSMLCDLIIVKEFEQFIHTRFPGAKRFSIEGGDATILALLEVLDLAKKSENIEEIIVGMAHRGRLSALTSVFGKGYDAVFAEFQGNTKKIEGLNNSGDVKYHMGRSTDIQKANGKNLHLTMLPNPSHLEAVDPVLLGKVRAEQDLIADKERNRVAGVLVHGDAAFCGQGVVAESFYLSEIDAYHVGGILHIVTNNQVGFTATPEDSRKTRYPTEFAKIIEAPILHVNGDDPVSVIIATRIAESFRKTFKKDVVIDIVCYRRFGHNEGDEPFFTQPIMYKVIKDHKTVSELYGNDLIVRKIITDAQIKEIKETLLKKLDQAFNDAKNFSNQKADWLEGNWVGIIPYNKEKEVTEKTGIEKDVLQKIGQALTIVPSNFHLNSKIKRLLDAKKKMFETGENFDWAAAEALAFGSLLLDKVKIRFTGQDCRRGTFSHRHAVLIDQENQNEYIPLNNIDKEQNNLEIYDSNLSEYAVLGFEYGYSTSSPNNLVIWEAQFGDFSNGAQIIIDQFIASAETKWLRMSGLVMLLPHSFEGQGPEHSSARLERYLQLCAEDNMQVVNITTPANYFHALRRQITGRDFRKPLIVMSPKSLLRHRLVLSSLDEMTGNTHFIKVIDDQEIKDKKGVKRVILCSGKVYYDLYEARASKALNNIAIIRIEQLYPFPEKEIRQILADYPDADIIWCQEEPKNMGSWQFICHLIEDVLKDIRKENNRPCYIGRKASASPAVGYAKLHQKEQDELINNALKI